MKNQEAYATHLSARWAHCQEFSEKCRICVTKGKAIWKKRMAAAKWDVCCQLLGDQMAPQSSLGYQIWSTLSGSWPIGLLQVYELTTKKIFFSMAYIKAEYTLNIFSTKLLTSIMTSTYCGISNWIYLLWDSFPGFCAIPTPRNSLLVDKTMEMLTTICQRNSSPRFKF